MKKTLVFLTDSIIFGVFIGLVVLAFLVTYSLSPVTYDAQDEQNNYVQISGDIPVLEGEFRFEENLKLPESVTAKIEKSDEKYVFNLYFENLKEKEYFNLLKVVNPDNLNQRIAVKIVGPVEEMKDIDTVLLVNEEKVESNKNGGYEIIIDANSVNNMSLELNPRVQINYPFELYLEFTKGKI